MIDRYMEELPGNIFCDKVDFNGIPSNLVGINSDGWAIIGYPDIMQYLWKLHYLIWTLLLTTSHLWTHRNTPNFKNTRHQNKHIIRAVNLHVF